MNAQITLQISKQGSRYVAYSPALDLSTSGKTESDVKKRFAELVPLFLEELTEAGTLANVLTELGWEKKGKEQTAGWRPPHVTSEAVEVRIPVAV